MHHLDIEKFFNTEGDNNNSNLPRPTSTSPTPTNITSTVIHTQNNFTVLGTHQPQGESPCRINPHDLQDRIEMLEKELAKHRKYLEDLYNKKEETNDLLIKAFRRIKQLENLPNIMQPAHFDHISTEPLQSLFPEIPSMGSQEHPKLNSNTTTAVEIITSTSLIKSNHPSSTVISLDDLPEMPVPCHLNSPSTQTNANQQQTSTVTIQSNLTSAATSTNNTLRRPGRPPKSSAAQLIPPAAPKAIPAPSAFVALAYKGARPSVTLASNPNNFQTQNGIKRGTPIATTRVTRSQANKQPKTSESSVSHKNALTK